MAEAQRARRRGCETREAPDGDVRHRSPLRTEHAVESATSGRAKGSGKGGEFSEVGVLPTLRGDKNVPAWRTGKECLPRRGDFRVYPPDEPHPLRVRLRGELELLRLFRARD